MNTLLARAELMRRTTPLAPATERLVHSVGLEEAVRLIRDEQAPANVQAEIVAPRGSEAADREALEGDTYRLLTPESDEWPIEQLAVLTERGIGAPLGLWVYGPGPLQAHVSEAVAVAPHLQATKYGADVTKMLVGDLTKSKVRTVVGTMRGLETTAREAACLRGRGPVIALRCGLGAAFQEPAIKRALDSAVRFGGLAISAEPMNGAVGPETFARHSLLVAALAQCTLVVETRISDRMPLPVTAAQALDRPLLVVPGPITSAGSWGAGQLLVSGAARAVLTAAHIREFLGSNTERGGDVPPMRSAGAGAGAVPSRTPKRDLTVASTT